MNTILDTWTTFAPKRKLRHEDRITAVFREALKAAYAAAGREWFVTLEDPIVDPEYGTQTGRNDLRFYPPKHYGQTVFFTVECKRLHVKRAPTVKAKQRARAAGKRLPKYVVQPLAADYVMKGVRRFVRGQYSSGLPCGGMFAYVLDNRLLDAFDRVCREITTRSAKLSLNKHSPLVCPSSVLPTWQYSADTVHMRADGAFTLHHLLVGMK